MPEIKCQHTELVDVGKLIPHPKNPHRHSPEQIKRLAELIKYQGVRHPIIVSKRSGFIVVGHGRLESMKLAGMTEVPVDYQDFDSEASEYAFIVSDNSIGKDEWAFLDQKMIIDDLQGFENFNISMLGLRDLNLPNMPIQIDPMETVPTSESESDTNGQSHRIILFFDQQEYQRINQLAMKAIKSENLSDMSMLFSWLLESYESEHE